MQINSIKRQLIFKLEGRCVDCGELDPRLLEIDYKHKNHFLEFAYFKGDLQKMYETYLMEFEEESQFLQVKCVECFPHMEFNESEQLIIESFNKMNKDIMAKKFDKTEDYFVLLLRVPQLLQTSNRFFKMMEGYALSIFAERLPRNLLRGI